MVTKGRTWRLRAEAESELAAWMSVFATASGAAAGAGALVVHSQKKADGLPFLRLELVRRRPTPAFVERTFRRFPHHASGVIGTTPSRKIVVLYASSLRMPISPSASHERPRALTLCTVWQAKLGPRVDAGARASFRRIEVCAERAPC